MTEEVTNQAGGAHDVFVSYASQDVTVADSIIVTLEKSHLNVRTCRVDLVYERSLRASRTG